MDPIYRRQFLNTTAKGAAAGLLLHRAASGQTRGANDRLVAGVMGLERGQALATGFAKQPHVDVKYVCDVDSSRADACARSVAETAATAPRPIGDFRTILDDPDVDVLVCAAPNHWHAPATILACEAGKHVYVEKPCSHNPWEGEMMVRAANKNGRCVQMGAQRRSGPGFQQAVDELRQEVIGNVYLARAWYRSLRPSIGHGSPTNPPAELDYDLWQGPAPRTAYLSNRVHYNWHWFWHWGNGELGNNGVHTLDIARWGLGVDYPVRVTSSGGRYRWQDDQETPDTHTACFEFPDGKMATWEGASCNRHGSGFVTFYGSDGAMELDQDGSYRIYQGSNDQLIREEKATSRGDSEHIANLLDAIRNDDPGRLNLEILSGHQSTLLCHLGNIAHRVGRVLQCDAENGRILDDQAAQGLWKRTYEPGWEPVV